MTQDQLTRYETALARARDRHVFVCGTGTCDRANHRFYLVNSSTHDGCYYQVIQRGAILSCSCPAGAEGRYCMHRAAVSYYVAHAGQQLVQ